MKDHQGPLFSDNLRSRVEQSLHPYVKENVSNSEAAAAVEQALCAAGALFARKTAEKLFAAIARKFF